MRSLNFVKALLALSLTSCAMDSERSAVRSDAAKRDAIEAEKTAAMDAYNKCVTEAARKLDDGSSDPSLIALVVEPDCKDEFSQYVKASGTGMTSNSFAKFSETLEYNQTELTAGIIQKLRSVRARQN